MGTICRKGESLDKMASRGFQASGRLMTLCMSIVDNRTFGVASENTQQRFQTLIMNYVSNDMARLKFDCKSGWWDRPVPA